MARSTMVNLVLIGALVCGNAFATDGLTTSPEKTLEELIPQISPEKSLAELIFAFPAKWEEMIASAYEKKHFTTQDFVFALMNETASGYRLSKDKNVHHFFELIILNQLEGEHQDYVFEVLTKVNVVASIDGFATTTFSPLAVAAESYPDRFNDIIDGLSPEAFVKVLEAQAFVAEFNSNRSSYANMREHRGTILGWLTLFPIDRYCTSSMPYDMVFRGLKTRILKHLNDKKTLKLPHSMLSVFGHMHIHRVINHQDFQRLSMITAVN